jgi:hypothetical protein
MIRSPPREPEIERRIAAGDVAWLLRQAEGERCGCLGLENGEPRCPCQMTSLAVRNMVSYAALKRGKIVRIKSSQ